MKLPDGSLPDIARLLQTIKYKLYLRQSATQKKSLFQPPPFQSSFCCVESVWNCFTSYQNEDQIVNIQIYISVFMKSSPLYHDHIFYSISFMTSKFIHVRVPIKRKQTILQQLNWNVKLFLINMIFKYDFMIVSDIFNQIWKLIRDEIILIKFYDRSPDIRCYAQHLVQKARTFKDPIYLNPYNSVTKYFFFICFKNLPLGIPSTHTYNPLMCVAHEYRVESTQLKHSPSHWG